MCTSTPGEPDLDRQLDVQVVLQGDHHDPPRMQPPLRHQTVLRRTHQLRCGETISDRIFFSDFFCFLAWRWGGWGGVEQLLLDVFLLQDSSGFQGIVRTHWAINQDDKSFPTGPLQQKGPLWRGAVQHLLPVGCHIPCLSSEKQILSMPKESKSRFMRIWAGTDDLHPTSSLVVHGGRLDEVPGETIFVLVEFLLASDCS